MSVFYGRNYIFQVGARTRAETGKCIATILQDLSAASPRQVRNRTAASKLSRICSYRKGVSASPDKIKVIGDYPTPKNVKNVRPFLGLASFYRRLVQDFATVAKLSLN